MHVQTCSIAASRFISNLARSQPPSVSLNSHDYGLQTHSIMASMCISKLTRSRSRSASLCSLNHGLQVYLEIPLMTASKCITKLARSWPRCVSLRSVDLHFRDHLKLLSEQHLQSVQIYRVKMGSYIDTWMRIQTAYMTLNNC